MRWLVQWQATFHDTAGVNGYMDFRMSSAELTGLSSAPRPLDHGQHRIQSVGKNMTDSKLAEFTLARLAEQVAIVTANFPEAGKGVLAQLARERDLVETFGQVRTGMTGSGSSPRTSVATSNSVYSSTSRSSRRASDS